MSFRESNVILRRGARELVGWLRHIHSAEYLTTKEKDFRLFTRGALVITALFLLLTISWDYAIDPDNAGRAIWLRFVQCGAIVVWTITSWRNIHSFTARAGAVLMPLVASAAFIQVLSILENGAVYGVGGFLYFFIFGPFLVVGQSITFAVFVLTLICVFPMLVEPLGLSAGLDWRVYNAYVWMGFLPIVCIQLLCEFLYSRVFIYRSQVEALAVTDALTGLANRRYFLIEGKRTLEGHRRSRRNASLIFIDIDRFKRINDTYGHATGDAALCHLVETLTPYLRQSDLMARFGGEEFVVLLPETTFDEALDVAERMRVALRERPFTIPGVADPTLTMTLSAGVATFQPNVDADSDADIDVLIHAADRALYDAKNNGRDQVAGAPLHNDANPPAQRPPHA